MTRTRGALVVAGFVLLAVAGVLLRPAFPVDETRYLAVAWEMWQSGDLFVPTRNYEIYSQKPPLLFWAINLVWSLTGVSGVAARLVGPAFALLTLLLTGVLARRLWPDDKGIASRAMVALAGTAIFAASGSLLMFDTALAAATVGGMLALVGATADGRWRWWVALGVAIGLGVLAKGPVILIHLAPAMVFVRFWAPRGPATASRRVATGAVLAIGVGLAVVSLWLVPALVSGGADYREAVLWKQSAGRMAGSFAHARPLWFYLALLPLLLFPWAWMPGLWRAARAVSWAEPGLRLAAIWAGSALVLFSLISGKQMHYLVPELPAVALVVARLARGLRPGVILACIPVAVAVAAVVALASGRVGGGAVGDLLQPAAWVAAWAFLSLALVWVAARVGGLAGGAVLTLGGLLSLNLLVGITEIGGSYDSARLARIVAPYEDRGIAWYGQTFHAEINFAGRLASPVATPRDAGDLAQWVAGHPEGVIVARPDRTAPSWPPRETVRFRNSRYGIWHAEDAPQGTRP